MFPKGYSSNSRLKRLKNELRRNEINWKNSSTVLDFVHITALIHGTNLENTRALI